MKRESTSAVPRPADVSRRALLHAAGGTSLASLATTPAAAVASGRTGRPGFATFEWLGTAGWRVRTSTSTLLVDPYLSRFDTGLAAGRFDASTPLVVDTGRIDDALGAPGTPDGAADLILVTHTHWDHFADVPTIAAARGATVFTSLTGHHLAQAMGLDQKQVAVVKGGEELGLGDVVVRVVPSLHSRTGNGGLLFPGIRIETADRPQTIADLPEGDTLGFVIRPPDGAGVLLLGASDIDDQALAGLDDIHAAMLPVPSNDVTVDYAGRLMRALGKPRTVVLTHWDDFESRLVNPPRVAAGTRARMRDLTDAVRRVSPRTRVIVPSYLEPVSLW